MIRHIMKLVNFLDENRVCVYDRRVIYLTIKAKDPNCGVARMARPCKITCAPSNHCAFVILCNSHEPEDFCKYLIMYGKLNSVHVRVIHGMI